MHFACHGHADTDRPSASYLLLHDYEEQPLTAFDIASQSVRGVLAFLSACSTTRTRGDLADEAIHLTSSFQLAGYPHVVGTLWPVQDAQAVEIARHFYRMVTAGSDADPSRIAAALHGATRHLRADHPDAPWLWAPYLHAGLEPHAGSAGGPWQVIGCRWAWLARASRLAIR